MFKFRINLFFRIFRSWIHEYSFMQYLLQYRLRIFHQIFSNTITRICLDMFSRQPEVLPEHMTFTFNYHNVRGFHKETGNNANIGIRDFTTWKQNSSNKMLPAVRIELRPLSNLWFQAQHVPFWANWESACKTETVFSLCSHAVLILSPKLWWCIREV